MESASPSGSPNDFGWFSIWLEGVALSGSKSCVRHYRFRGSFLCRPLSHAQFLLLLFVHLRYHALPDKNYGESVEARDTLRHGLWDGSLQVLVNILVQRHSAWGTVKSRLARALHNVLITWRLAESHTASPFPNKWRRFFVGEREHCYHHQAGFDGAGSGKPRRYQQFFFTWTMPGFRW